MLQESTECIGILQRNTEASAKWKGSLRHTVIPNMRRKWKKVLVCLDMTRYDWWEARLAELHVPAVFFLQEPLIFVESMIDLIQNLCIDRSNCNLLADFHIFSEVLLRSKPFQGHQRLPRLGDLPKASASQWSSWGQLLANLLLAHLEAGCSTCCSGQDHHPGQFRWVL